MAPHASRSWFVALGAAVAVVIVAIGGVRADDEPLMGDPAVAATLEKAKLQYEVTEEGDFKLLYQLDGGRTQTAYVNSKLREFGSMKLREVWSIAVNSATELDAKTTSRLLVENSENELGGWRMTSGEKNSRIAYYCVPVDFDCDAATLAKVLEFVVKTADRKEQELTQGDMF